MELLLAFLIGSLIYPRVFSIPIAAIGGLLGAVIITAYLNYTLMEISNTPGWVMVLLAVGAIVIAYVFRWGLPQLRR